MARSYTKQPKPTYTTVGEYTGFLLGREPTMDEILAVFYLYKIVYKRPPTLEELERYLRIKQKDDARARVKNTVASGRVSYHRQSSSRR